HEENSIKLKTKSDHITKMAKTSYIPEEFLWITEQLNISVKDGITTNYELGQKLDITMELKKKSSYVLQQSEKI
ncbi:hypothetical protein Q6312_28590, partial [Klebsiella pneumoniae]|uniref:hypothetical protein n=1 Tax=Klebsiella pneumoniae TaxID=573 RepID=UPI0027314877